MQSSFEFDFYRVFKFWRLSCLTAGSDSTRSPVRQCGLMEQALGVSVLVSPRGLHSSLRLTPLLVICIQHGEDNRPFLQNSGAECLSVWAAV